ncbi:TPA: hypothetical protein DDW35_03120, partial [Candidatus Sumerlaeota bacterium]|nr:hypothetical protein [Candidatus Sumerlaeota bacterium]
LVLLAFVFSLVEKSTPHRWLPLLVGAASLAVVTIFYGTIRFRYPLSPLIAVYAALFIRNCFQGDVSPIFRNLIPLHRKTNV